MSDWSMYELDDIVWDVFGDSYDRVVPHPDVGQLNDSKAQCDSHKKARHDLGGPIERNPDNNGSSEKNISRKYEEAGVCLSLTEGNSLTAEHSASHASSKAAFAISFSPACTDKVVISASDNIRTDENLFSGQTINENENEHCSDGSILEDTSVVDKSSLGPMSVSISPDDSYLDFLVNEPKNVENSDILDYEWSDIGNFEDVDRMLSNGYSQFGQEGSEAANELSWHPSSSYAIDGSEEVLNPGFQSSYSDLTAFRAPLEHNEANMMDWPGHGEAIMRSYKPSHLTYGSYGHWSDGDAQCDEGFTSKGVVSMPRDVSKCMLPQLEGKKKGQNLEHAGGDFYDIPIQLVQSTATSTCQTHHSPLAVQPNSIFGTDSSSSLHSYDSHLEIINTHSSQKVSIECLKADIKAKKKCKVFSLNNNISAALNQGHRPMQEIPHPLLTPLHLTDRKKTKETHPGQQPHGRLAIGNSAECTATQTLFSNQSSSQKKSVKLENLGEGDSEREEASTDPLPFEVDHPSQQESSATMWSENISSGATSLRQLQDVMDRLDLRTKLCIRDGLYRLARNAQQRHCINGTISGCKASIQGMGVDEPKRCPGFIDVETGTNPIDRSIAHLLFYRASEQSLSPTDDAMSFQSRIISDRNIIANSTDHLTTPYQP